MSESIDNSRAPKRVLVWADLYWPHVGGIERFIEALIANLRPRGFEFAVITSGLDGSPAEEVHCGAQVYRLPLRGGASGSLADFKRSLDRVRSIKESFRPQLSHLNSNGPSLLYHVLTAKNHPHPALFTFHFDAMPGAQNDSLRKALELCQKTIGVSQDSLDKAIAAFPEIAPRSSVIYNGLPFPEQDSSPKAPIPGHFLCWGRLAANKGFDVALRAFARFAEGFPEARLTIGGEGSERERLTKLRSELGLEKRVSLPGYLDAKALDAEIASCVAVLMPSLEQECFGLVALEAMQRQRPVIGSRYGGLAEVIADGVSGFLVPAGDDRALSEAMRRFAENPELTDSMGSAAARRARELFSIQKMADAYQAAYLELISKQ